MMSDALFQSLLDHQTDTGAFLSTVETPQGEKPDENAFVTASVALILLDLKAMGRLPYALAVSLENALDFIQACACPDLRDAFRFYPPSGTGPQLLDDLPADADDTALAWTALMRAGRRSRSTARKVLPPLFGALLVRCHARGDAPWVRKALHRTWFSDRVGENPVDLCVNANIAACLAEAGLEPRAPMITAITHACEDMVPTRSAMRVLAPYYADPAEIEIALERATRHGVPALTPALRALRPHSLISTRLQNRHPARRPLYCNAHGAPLWRSAALQLARRITDRCAHGSPSFEFPDDVLMETDNDVPAPQHSC